MNLVHHQAPNVPWIRRLDRYNNVVGTCYRIGRAHARQIAQCRDDRPDLTCLGLDQHIGPGMLHGGTSPLKVMGDTQCAAPTLLKRNNGAFAILYTFFGDLTPSTAV